MNKLRKRPSLALLLGAVLVAVPVASFAAEDSDTGESLWTRWAETGPATIPAAMTGFLTRDPTALRRPTRTPALP